MRTSARPELGRSRVTAGSGGDSSALAAQARGVLAEAWRARDAGDRFRLAHLAALRAAAAVIAERGRPAASRRRLLSVWVLIDAVAPEFGEWAAMFAAGAPIRAAIEAGALHPVSTRQADDELRAAAAFLDLVQASLGMLAAPLAS